MDRKNMAAVRQMERTIRKFLRRKEQDGFSDLLDVSQQAHSALSARMTTLGSSERAQFIAFNQFESVVREVLLEKLRRVSRDYLASGTDFSFASGRVWATTHKRVEFLQLLLSDLKEVRSLFPDFSEDPVFIAALHAVRREFKVEAAYNELKEYLFVFAAMKDGLLKRGVRIMNPSSLGDITVRLERDMTATYLVRELNHSILSAGSGIDARLFSQLSQANPSFSTTFDSAVKVEAEHAKLPKGTSLSLSNSDFAWELQRLEVDICRKVMDLILDAQMLSEDPSTKLLPEAEGQVLALKYDLEKLANKFGAIFERPDETAEDKKRLQRLSRQVVLTEVAKPRPSVDSAFEYLRSLVPVINDSKVRA